MDDPVGLALPAPEPAPEPIGAPLALGGSVTPTVTNRVARSARAFLTAVRRSTPPSKVDFTYVIMLTYAEDLLDSTR